MTSKEKAKELVKRFASTLRADNPSWVVETKQCALICVDEIIDRFQNIPDIYCLGSIIIDEIQYWNKVKQEIEKL